jgi:hypothetical protein
MVPSGPFSAPIARATTAPVTVFMNAQQAPRAPNVAEAGGGKANQFFATMRKTLP